MRISYEKGLVVVVVVFVSLFYSQILAPVGLLELFITYILER